MKTALRPVRLQVFSVVLVCSPDHWQAVLTQFPNTRPGLFQGRSFLSRNFGPRRVVLLRCGQGSVPAAADAQFAIDRWHPSVLMATETQGDEVSALHQVAAINGVFVVERRVLPASLDQSLPELIAAVSRATSK